MDRYNAYVHNRLRYFAIPQHLRPLLAILCLVVLLAGSLWILFFFQLPGRSLFWSSLHNAGHALIFLGFALILALIFHYLIVYQRVVYSVLGSAFISLSFGGLVELLQAIVGRDASWGDFQLDAIGTASGISLYLAMLLKGKKRLLSALTLCVLLSVSMASPIRWRIAEYKRERALPVLVDFDNDWLNSYVSAKSSTELSFPNAPGAWKNNTSLVAKVHFFPGPWPGITLVEVHKDWSAYAALTFDVYNPQANAVRLVVRVHDSKHNNEHSDRFNRTFAIAPGLQRITIPMDDIRHAPKGRLMEMRHIASVMFYSYKLKEEQILYFDNIALQ